MSIPPPPYSEITGIYTTDDKHQNITKTAYDGLAKPGQLVVDTTDYSLWVGNAQGNLNLVTSGSGASPAGNNTQIQFNDTGSFGVGSFTFDKTSNTLGISSQTITGNATGLTFTGVMTGNGAGLTNILPDNLVSMPSAQTLLVDPDGNNAIADGSINKPFQTIQAAHDYAANNIASSEYAVIKLNAGNYSGNVTLSRAKTAIVGASDGVIRSSWINGAVTVNLPTSSGAVSSDVFALENVIVTTDNIDAITLAGNQRYVFFARNVYGFTSGATANVLNVTNTASGGIKLDLFNTVLQSDGAGTVVNTLNTYYLNMNYCTLSANTGPALQTTTTSGIVTTSRITTRAGSNVYVNVSQFAPNSTVTFGVCTFESTATNGNGLYLTSGSTTALGSCAFNIPTGTGFAVAGNSGSVLLKSANNNQIAYNTNGATQGTVTVVPMSYL